MSVQQRAIVEVDPKTVDEVWRLNIHGYDFEGLPRQYARLLSGLLANSQRSPAQAIREFNEHNDYFRVKCGDY